VQDRTIYEDSVFARMLCRLGLMDPRDYNTYIELFRNMSNFMCRPHLIVYLDVDPETSLRRVRERKREAEKGITLEYLQALYEEYENFVAEVSKMIPLIRVSWKEFGSAEEMAEIIKREYLDHSFLRTVAERRIDP
jgi:deoxyadenosine kinase